MTSYQEFLDKKSQLGGQSGFSPLWIPDFLFPFQQSLVEWNLVKGKAATFADTGLGKTIQELTWAENVVRKTNKRVLIATPLAVSDQTIREGEKFGIECKRSKTGNLPDSKIVITNYESLHKFDSNDFVGMAADESACLKSFDSVTKAIVTEFMRRLPYRSLYSATPAPNDFIELGTSSECLGELGYMDMLGRFFKNDQNSLHPTSGRGRFERGLLTQNKWRFRGHSEEHFWKWVCSWARACRKPSDLGFDDTAFILPPLTEKVTVVKSSKPLPGFLFEMPAVGLKEQREELRHTLKERCEAAASKVEGNAPAVLWCHLNAEGDLLESLISGARQIKGSQSDDEKEELFRAFGSGQLQKLVTKSKIAAWGLNWQHCARMTFFPSHSFEGYYQSVRRCWRFGQKREVVVDMITTEGQKDVLLNLQRKAKAADRMFDALIRLMHEASGIKRTELIQTEVRLPSWL